MTDNDRPDPSAWLAAHGDALYRYALTRLRDASAAEDAVQETLLAAWQGRDRYAGRASVRTWLVGILKHKIVDHLRRQAREQPHDPQADDDPSQESFFENDAAAHWRRPPSVWEHPEQSLEQAEFWAVFVRCLDGLSPTQARALCLAVIDGLDAAESCKVLGLTTTNLWVLLHRSRLRMRQCLEDRWFGQYGG